MKLSKLALFVLSSTLLTACSFSYQKSQSGTHYETHFESHFTTVDTVSSADVSSNKETISNNQQSSVTTTSSAAASSINQTSSAVTSSSTQASSSVTVSSSQTITSSTTEVDGTAIEFSFLNPSCGPQGKDSLDAKLKEAMNASAGLDIVSKIENQNCQIMNGAPTKEEQILTIGSSSSEGELVFTFAETIKTVKLVVETYNKTYTDNTGEHYNVENNSVLYFNSAANKIDLKPVDGKAVTKEYTSDINSKSFKVYNKGGKQRAFIRSLVIVY